MQEPRIFCILTYYLLQFAIVLISKIRRKSTLGDLTEKTYGFKVYHGPSVKNGMPDDDEWQAFRNDVDHNDAKGIIDLWYKKSTECGGVPDRATFSFEELVPYGRNIYMAKYNDQNDWDTTYCGSAIVSNVGVDATGKSLDVFAKPETLKFWTDNLDVMIENHNIFWEFFTLEFADKEYINCSAVTMPLKTAESNSPNIQLVYEIYSDQLYIPDHMK